jgi:hypothetical protein
LEYETPRLAVFGAVPEQRNEASNPSTIESNTVSVELPEVASTWMPREPAPVAPAPLTVRWRATTVAPLSTSSIAPPTKAGLVSRSTVLLTLRVAPAPPMKTPVDGAVIVDRSMVRSAPLPAEIAVAPARR